MYQISNNFGRLDRIIICGDFCSDFETNVTNLLQNKAPVSNKLIKDEYFYE